LKGLVVASIGLIINQKKSSMKSKKSESVNLENNRPTFLLIGLIFSLGMVLQSFEWLKSNVVIKPISGVEMETLYEPINEVIILRPKPNKEVYTPRTKKTSKAEVVVTKKIDEDPIDTKKDDIAKKEPVKFNPAMDLGVPDIADDFGGEEGFDADPEVDSTYEYVGLEQVPEFLGGNKAMLSFIGKNIKYPVYSQRMGNSGKVYISFVIDKQGSVTDVNIVKGVDKYIDAEAKRVIGKMPKWRPGKQRDRLVKVRYTIPVNFVLQ